MRIHVFKKITALLPALLAGAALLSAGVRSAEPVDPMSSEGFVMVSDIMPNVLQEIRYYSGKKTVHCANNVLCAMNGGCKNRILRERMEKDKY